MQNENYKQFPLQNGSHQVPTTKLTSFTVRKGEWNALVNPRRMDCMYSSMVKGTSWAEQQKNQARSLSHCQVTLFWRHQAVSQSIS